MYCVESTQRDSFVRKTKGRMRVNKIGTISLNTVDYARIEEIISLNKCNSKIFTKNLRNSLSNPLDWSFSSINQANNQMGESRPDLYQLWHSFESNTWSSFDSISESIRETKKKTDLICDHLGVNLESSMTNVLPASRSTLVETITADGDQLTKLDKIEQVICDLNDKLSTINTSLMEMAVTKIMSNPTSESNSPPEKTTSLSSNNVKERVFITSIDIDSDKNITDSTDTDTSSIIIDQIDDISDDNLYDTPTLNSPTKSNLNEDRTTTNIQPNRELYLSKLPTRITDDTLRNYMRERGIIDTSSVKLIKLVKKGVDQTSLSFVSYKIDTTNDIAHIISDDGFWPDQCIIKEFIHKPNGSKNLFSKRNKCAASLDSFLSTTRLNSQPK